MNCPFCSKETTRVEQYTAACDICKNINNLESLTIYHKDSKVTGFSIKINRNEYIYLIMTIYEKNETIIYYGIRLALYSSLKVGTNSTLTPLKKLKNYTGFTPSNAKQKLQNILTFL